MRRRSWLSSGLGLAAAALAQGPGAALAALPELIAQTKPSVLPVGGFDALASPRFAFRGTAFIVADGRLAVTNAHVVADGKIKQWALQIPPAGGGASWRMAEVIARDAAHDLALLRIEGDPLPPLRLGAPEGVREGQAVALMGFPIGGVLGFRPVTHRAIVSSIAAIVLPAATASQLGQRAVAQIRAGGFDIYQLDGTAYPGNSGGPVLHADTGEVVAVVNMVLTKGSRESALQHPSGISYAIPVRWVHELLAPHGR
jgi:S1-C subfamily serine protease